MPPVAGNVVDLLEGYTRVEDSPLHKFQQNVKSIPCPRDINSVFEVNPSQIPLRLKVGICIIIISVKFKPVGS